MKTVKAGKYKNKKAKIVPMNTTPAVGAGKTGKSLEKQSHSVSADTQTPQITYDMIAQRAWSIWMAKGRVPGQEEANWLQAERELKMGQNRKGSVLDTDKD